MRLLVILSCLIAIQGAALSGAEETHDRITINGVHYGKEVLKSGIGRIRSIAIDSLTNTLYFSYPKGTSKIELDNRRFVELDIKDKWSQTIDEKNHVLYVESLTGINVDDMINNTNKATINVPDTFICKVYFNEILYYTDFPDRNLYTHIDGVSKPFENLKDGEIWHLCIDKDGDIFYANYMGLFSLKKGDKNAVAFKELVFVKAMATDIHGNAFVCIQDGIYKVDKPNAALVKIVDVPCESGLAFDKYNHIVYSDADSLIYLRPYLEY